MKCRMVRYGERNELQRLHPVLVEERPDLLAPAFPKNPVTTDGEFPYLFYFIEGDQIVGSRKAIPDTVKRGGELYPFAWLFDAYVNPNFHGQGIGTKLVQAQVEEFGRRNQLSGATYSTETMLRIYEKLGFEIGICPRLAAVRNTRPFLQERVGATASVISPFANLALGAKAWLKGSLSSSDYSLTHVAQDEVSSAIANVQNSLKVYHWDTSDGWIASRLKEDDKIYLLQVAGSQTSAMFVTRLREQESADGEASLKRLTLMHYRCPPQALDQCARALNKLSRRENADVADIVTSDPEMITAFEKHGFSQRSDGMTFVYKLPPGMVLPEAANLSDWHLTHFCSDGFLFD